MYTISFHETDFVNESELAIAVVMVRHKDKWILCKHRKRDTWEIPGGHIEEGETWLEATKRELYEETGVTKAKIKPIAIYKLATYGMLSYAEVEEIGELPESEIEKIGYFDVLPENTTYPWHTDFFNTVINAIEDKE